MSNIIIPKTVAGNKHGAIVGSESVKVEGIIISLLSALFGFASQMDWGVHPVFWLALILTIAIAAIRVMAGYADDPNIELIQKSLPYSSNLSQLAIIGVVGSITTGITPFIEGIPPIATFTVITVSLTFIFALAHQIFLGNYVSLWKDIALEETDNNVIGNRIINVFEIVEEMVDQAENGKTGLGFRQKGSGESLDSVGFDRQN